MGESKFSEDAYESKFADGGESKRAGAGGRAGAGKPAGKPAAKKGGEGKQQARDENTIHTLVTKATSYCFCKFAVDAALLSPLAYSLPRSSLAFVACLLT
jgi:hypothetical protein